MFEQLKKDVFAANLELVKRGLVIYTWGNVSGIDRDKGVVAIKPSGVSYDDMTWEQIVLIDLEDGKTIEEGALNPSSDTPTHLYLYRAFPALGGITHTHSTYATAWAQAGKDIPCMGTTHADGFRGCVPCTRYVDPEETERAYEAETGKVIAEAFKGRDPMHTPAVLVRGHGPFTWGKDAAKSVYNAAVLEETAKMALLTYRINPEAIELPHWIQDKHFLRKHGPNAYYGQK